MSLYTFFGRQCIQKAIYIIEFCQDSNFPTPTKENTCYKIPQNQICIDLLHTIDDQKVFPTRLL